MNPVYNALVYVVWFLATYYLVFLGLVLIYKRKSLYEAKERLGRTPFVSFVVPAFNEEKDIDKTIASLKDVNYEKVEFLVISDGSTDDTVKVARKHIGNDSRFKLIANKKNRGKAAVLNSGISKSRGEFVVCIDADSMVEPEIVQKILPYFKNEKVGAVTVSVEVANRKKVLNKVFDLEFMLGLSLFLKVFSFFDSIFVTPGPCSAYRRSAMLAIGGFDEESIVEDCEIAYRLRKHHFTILNALDANVQTHLPEDFRGAFVQRRRWYSGALQTLVKHKDMIFNKKYGFFGFMVPANYVIIFLGISLFLVSLWLALSRVLETLWNYQYTNFNFFDNLFKFEFDILRMGNASIVGATAFIATIAFMLLGIYFTRKNFSSRKIGIAGYPLLFFLYQIFWIGAIISVIRGKKIKWR